MLLFQLRVFNQQLLGKLFPLTAISSSSSSSKLAFPIITSFRCWPIDIDGYYHMNNASFLRVAELARWRIGATMNMMPPNLQCRFLLVEVILFCILSSLQLSISQSINPI